jgi:hypothetical protein
MKNLKPLLIPFGLIVLVLGIFSFTNPEDNEEDKKCTIKIVKIINGEKTEIDSTFKCDEDLAWASSIKGMEGSLKEALKSLMIKAESGEDSFSFNMDFDENDENGVKVMKFKAGDGEEEVEMNFDFKKLDGKDGEGGIFKMMINGESIDINVSDIEKHVEHLGADINIEEGDIEILIKNDENGGEAHSVKIIKTVDDDGKVSVKKIVNGEEMELDENQIVEMNKKHKMIFISDDSNKTGSHEMKIDINVDDENGKETKKVIIISTVVSDEKSSKKASKTNSSMKKVLEVDNLKFSPNPNDGKFDLSFNLDKKKPVIIKVIDLQGKEVYTETISNFDGQYFKSIDISDNKKGVYILGIKQGNKLKSSKMIIK